MTLKQQISNAIDALRRAFVEFLTLPSLSIIAFLALAYASYAVDKAKINWL